MVIGWSGRHLWETWRLWQYRVKTTSKRAALRERIKVWRERERARSEAQTSVPGHEEELVKDAKKLLYELNSILELEGERVLREAAKEMRQSEAKLIIEALVLGRENKPAEALREIRELAAMGWYEQVCAGVLLDDLLKNHPDLELAALAELMGEPAMLNAWQVADRL